MKRLYSVSYVRVFAASMVLLSHIAHKSEQYGFESLNWYNFRGFGVDLFFVLSGFIACYITYNKKISPFDFFKKRVERLIPLYWFFTTIALFIYLYNPNLVNSSGGETSILASYFLVPLGYKYLINNGWTLFYDFCFYIIFVSTLFLKISSDRRSIILLMILFTITFVGIFKQYSIFFNSLIMIEFACGIIIFMLFNKYNIGKVFSILAGMVGFGLLILQNNLGEIVTPLGRALSKGVPVSLIFISLLGFDKYLNPSNNLSFKIFSKVGEASYSIFLSHPFVLVVFAKLYKKVEFITFIPFALFLFLSSIIVGVFVYNYIEKPINKYMKGR